LRNRCCLLVLSGICCPLSAVSYLLPALCRLLLLSAVYSVCYLLLAVWYLLSALSAICCLLSAVYCLPSCLLLLLMEHSGLTGSICCLLHAVCCQLSALFAVCRLVSAIYGLLGLVCLLSAVSCLVCVVCNFVRFEFASFPCCCSTFWKFISLCIVTYNISDTEHMRLTYPCAGE
jgi:hypothetical protein